MYSVFRSSPPSVGFAQLSSAAGGSSGEPSSSSTAAVPSLTMTSRPFPFPTTSIVLPPPPIESTGSSGGTGTAKVTNPGDPLPTTSSGTFDSHDSNLIFFSSSLRVPFFASRGGEVILINCFYRFECHHSHALAVVISFEHIHVALMSVCGVASGWILEHSRRHGLPFYRTEWRFLLEDVVLLCSTDILDLPANALIERYIWMKASDWNSRSALQCQKETQR